MKYKAIMIETYLNIFKKPHTKNTFESFNHRNVDQLLLFKILNLEKSTNSSKACPKIKLFIYPTIFRRQEGKKEHTLQCMNNFRAPKPLFFERKTEGTLQVCWRQQRFRKQLRKEYFKCGGSQTRKQRGLLCAANKGFRGERKCKMGLRT